VKTRGGPHFAALRAVGLTVPEAVVADPEGGRDRLLRTAWAPDAADALIAAAGPSRTSTSAGGKRRR
jgi:hypothetical protein